MSSPHILKPSHMAAIRLIFLGMPVKEAADLIGVSHTYMSTVYRSRQGQEFALYLQNLANVYTARMLALGLMPKFVLESEDKPRRRRCIPRTAWNSWDALEQE